MNRALAGAAIAAAAMAISLVAPAPASACLRTLEVRFEPSLTAIVDEGSIAPFLAIPGWGARQKIAVRVAGPDHELARRRADSLAGILRAQGIDSRGIMIETDTGPMERAIVIVYPPPRVVEIAQMGQAAPAPRKSCGG